jgi:oleate hydratase
MNHPIKAYLVGGGIGSLAAAAFMIRDGGVAGSDITILRRCRWPAAASMAAATRNAATRCAAAACSPPTTTNAPGSCSRASLRWNIRAHVYDETWPSTSQQVRLARAAGGPQPLQARCHIHGLHHAGPLELLKLAEADEATLGNSAITDWLSPEFFDTKFWYMWATTFAFQPWHSAVEFKRYLHRFMMEFSRIETLAGVKRTVYNQYDSWCVRCSTGCSSRACRWLNSTVDDLELTE